MGARALVQWEQNRKNAPNSLQVDVYAGGVAPRTGLEEVTFYQVPYSPSTQGVDESTDIIARMPELEVLQLVSAGYEQILPLLPDGVSLCDGRGLHDARDRKSTRLNSSHVSTSYADLWLKKKNSSDV